MSKKSFLMALVTMAVLGCSAGASLYETSFEAPTFTAGESIDGVDGWVVTTATAIATDITPAPIGSGSQSLSIKRTGTSIGQADIGFIGSANVTAEFNFRMVGSTTMSVWDMRDSSGKRGPCVYYNSGTLRAYNGGTLISTGIVGLVDQTYTMKIVADASAGVHTYDVYIDGELLLDDYGFRESTADTLTNYHIMRLNSDNPLLIDDLTIIPEPASLGLLSLGSILFLRRKKK